MKALKILLSLTMVMTSIASCNMNNAPQPNLSNQIMGTYKGTLSTSLSQDAIAATAEITTINNYNIQVHCFNADIDTTFSLGLYPDESMMRVCFTGNDFMNQYGHNMSFYNQMMGGNQMMGNMSSGTSWQQHMIAEHNTSDKHYGYFDMNAKTFDYSFMSASNGYTRHFVGKR